MIPSPKLSLIISVYNKPEILRYLLAACERQSFREFEVIVGDDGSGPAVRQVVEEQKTLQSFPLVHIWHEDRGWRKNVMLNKAIGTAHSDYLVFIDGDCIPSRDFMLDHWTERLENSVLFGRRIEMSKRWSESLTLEKIRSGEFDRVGWKELLESLRGELSHFENGIRIQSRLLRTMLLRNATAMLGSNFSVAKKNMEAVNGFDELYNGPGCGEDTDIQYRLSLIGVRGRPLRNLAIQYHVYHPATRTAQDSWDRFHKIVKLSGEPRCRVGLQHIVEP